MYRKILCLCLILFSGIQILFKALALLLLSLFSYYFTFTTCPFVERKINFFECRSSFSIIVIVFSTLIYTVDMNEIIKIFCFIIMVSTNILFLLFSAVEFFKIFLQTYFKILKKSLPKIYLIILKINKIAQNFVRFSLRKVKRHRKSKETGFIVGKKPF